jgi:hypothetical protein
MQVLTRTVQVQARDFTTPTPSAETVANGTTCLAGTLSLPVPVINGPHTLGAFCLEHLGQFIANTVGEGPNAGVKWVERMVADDPVRWRYRWLINPDLDDVTCPFYAQQTGTYDPVANPSGWISGANLKANAIRHESGPTASHYAQFVAANASGNPGAGVEGELGEPSLDLSEFAQMVVQKLRMLANAVEDAAKNPEPPGADRDAANTFQGYINFAPYGQGCHP